MAGDVAAPEALLHGQELSAPHPHSHLAGPALSENQRVHPLEVQEDRWGRSLTPAPQQPVFTHPMPLRTRRYMVAIFSLTAAFIFSDQNLLAPNLSQAASDFGFNDVEKDTYLGGYLMASFFIIGAPASLLVGYLTDKSNRRLLLLYVVLIASVPCLATYWVTHYWQLLILRTLTGVSVGGCLPLIYSLLGDLFPITERSGMSAFIQIAAGVGLAVGQAVAAATGQSNWRLPFFIVAIPTIIVAFIMVATTSDPPRGAFEEALRGTYSEGDAYTETITWPKVRTLLRIPSNWLIIVQGLPGSLPWGMILTFFNDYFSQQKGFSIQAATLIVLMFGVGGAVGVIGGGALGQRLYNRKKEHLPIFLGFSILLGIGPVMYLVLGPLQHIHIGVTVIISLLGGMCGGVAGPNLKAVLLNVNEPESRGVAFALTTATDDLGKGLGPFIVAGFIKYLGRQGAFTVATCGWVPCALLVFSLAFYMRQDEDAMQARLAARVVANEPGTLAASDRDSFMHPGETQLTTLPLSNGFHRTGAPHPVTGKRHKAQAKAHEGEPLLQANYSHILQVGGHNEWDHSGDESPGGGSLPSLPDSPRYRDGDAHTSGGLPVSSLAQLQGWAGGSYSMTPGHALAELRYDSRDSTSAVLLLPPCCPAPAAGATPGPPASWPSVPVSTQSSKALSAHPGLGHTGAHSGLSDPHSIAQPQPQGVIDWLDPGGLPEVHVQPHAIITLGHGVQSALATSSGDITLGQQQQQLPQQQQQPHHQPQQQQQQHQPQ